MEMITTVADQHISSVGLPRRPAGGGGEMKKGGREEVRGANQSEDDIRSLSRR